MVIGFLFVPDETGKTLCKEKLQYVYLFILTLFKVVSVS